MREYDAALKLLLQASTDSVLQELTGVNVTRWLNVEMPQVQNSRVDLLGTAEDSGLVHVELQSTNDQRMALRMAEYTLRIYRRFKKFPRQVVLYVGEERLRMPASLDGPAFSAQYTLIDIRNIDASLLLASPHIEDNLLAVLAGLQNQRDTVRLILSRIAELDEPERRVAFERFLIISGLRRLAPTVEEEAQKMPILNDIMDHEVIGPAIRKGIQQGLEQGREEGRQAMLRRLLEKRFGSIPAWIEPRLTKLSAAELDALAVRVSDVSRLEELF
jgi:predicted transposase YdaD